MCNFLYLLHLDFLFLKNLMPCVGLDLCSYLYYKCFLGSQHPDHAALLSLVPIYVVSGPPPTRKDGSHKKEGANVRSFFSFRYV